MSITCQGCRTQPESSFDFTMAFQPILDARRQEIYAHEALVRGVNGESAGKILGQLAADLGLQQRLSINFLPNAVYEPAACIRMTVETARRVGLPLDRIIFEVTEGEQVVDHDKLIAIIRAYKEFGLLTAIDDFGAGYSGLNLLADFQPDIIKLDMALTRNIDSDRVRRSIVAGILTVCRELDIMVIAEGVETEAEYATLRELGVTYFQGYLFARPAFRDFAREINFPAG